MKLILLSILLILSSWQLSVAQKTPSFVKERVFILTDISNEPDDEESMVRFLVYANQYDIEGIVATTSTWLREGTREDLIRRQLDAYGKVRENLLVHEPGFPTRKSLLAVTTTGQSGYSMGDVGEGKTSKGSQLLLQAADKMDERPLWICVWGGANTLAQALYDARKERSEDELARLVKKLKVYSISDQDDAGPWLRKEFPGLFYIVSPSTTDSKEYYQATWTGISGDDWYRNGPGYAMELVSNNWLEENIINNHGPLGALYPRHEFIMEGDTPSFLGLINNGLGWAESPAYGGWGGRYVHYQAHGEIRPIWGNNRESRDLVTIDEFSDCSEQATIWRWRPHYQHDFAARLDWCVTKNYEDANHNPVAVLNSDKSKKIVKIMAKSGETVKFTADGSSDPDQDKLTTTWFIYQEAGSPMENIQLSANAGESTQLQLPEVKEPADIHVIMQVEDQGTPSLIAYRRAIIHVEP